jgi:hypothetical protein
MFSNWQGVASWKYLAVSYESVEKEKHLNMDCRKKDLLCQVYRL